MCGHYEFHIEPRLPPFREDKLREGTSVLNVIGDAQSHGGTHHCWNMSGETPDLR